MRVLQLTLLLMAITGATTLGAQVAPVLTTPDASAGDMIIGGADPNFTGTIQLGQDLALSFTATDVDVANTLTINISQTGGSLTGATAGFAQALPHQPAGQVSPHTVTLSGTAATVGTIDLQINVNDGTGQTDTYNLAITINPVNNDPVLGAPSGTVDIVVGGANPNFTGTATVGDDLAITFQATDADGADTLTVDAAVTGGSLTAAQAGFVGLPATSSGTSPESVSLTGTAANSGNIILTIDVDDGNGGTDTYTINVTINAANADPVLGAPSGTVDIVVGGANPNFTGTATVGDDLAITFQATDADGADTLTVDAAVTGGSLTAAQAGFVGLPATSSGTSPESVSLTGTAANSGNIILTIDVDDGNGGTDTYTINVTISAPSITVTAPNGGESWTVGGNQNVTWTSVGVPGTVEIDLSTDSGGTFPISLANATTNDGTQSITVPNNPGANCRVRVMDTATGTILDSSNANFTITTTPTITVTAPNGGENFSVGGNMNVTWGSGGVTGNVDILLSTDGGGSFPVTLVAGTANDNAQTIVVPNNPSTQCRVRIEDSNTGAIFDTSNANFTIAVAAPSAVTMSAASNPGDSNVSPGASKTMLGFRLTETGGGSSFTVTSVTVDINVTNNTGGVAVAAMTSVSLRRGGVLQTVTNGGAGWSVAGNVVTVNFTGLSSVVTAGGTGDFTVSIQFTGTNVASPNPRYSATIAPADVNGGASVSGSTVTGGTMTLVDELPGDPLDEDTKEDSCELATHGGPAWPLLAAGLVFAIVAMRRRKISHKEV
jgi:hypothetical protein